MQSNKNNLVDLPSEWRSRPMTLVEALRRRAEQEPEKGAYTFLPDGNAEAVNLTYGELDLKARAIGQDLISRGLRGERAILLYEPGLDFIAGFFGCLYAGLVAIPAYPARNARGVPRLKAIVDDARARVALTTSSVLARSHPLFTQTTGLEASSCCTTDEVERNLADRWIQPATNGSDLAFIQYTSGSTGEPKGVMLTHDNLLHNADLIYNAFEHTPDDKYVSWLPTFHDMGFMVGVLQPLYAGIPVVLMSPISFLQRPIQWLQSISRYRATTSGGPNFAYDLCVRKVSEQQLATLDLSSWTVAFNGAEPVRAGTLDRFAETFGKCGFRREAFYACYGLAEATLAVSGGRKSALPVVKTIKPRALQGGRVVEAASNEANATTIVGCGATLGDQKVAIVNPETLAQCPPGEVGEILVSGPSVALGYWMKPVETQETFHAYIADTGEGPFLRTGDLGFTRDGELFVNGRLKDLIIIRGVNHYPQDIELTVEHSHPALRMGCGAAFSVDVGGEERLVVVQELDGRKLMEPSEIIRSIRQSVTEAHELQVYAVVLVKPGTIQKTSSGKIQRHACRRKFLGGDLDCIHQSCIDDERRQPDEGSFVRKALLAIDPQMRLPIAESYILEQASRILRVSTSGLRAEQALSSLGLDSLKALELKNQIESHLCVSVSASNLLAGHSARQIASLILEQLNGACETPSIPHRPSAEQRIEYPLSFTQKALWFFNHLAPESAAYNTAFAVRLTPYIDVAALSRAFQALVDRHACLRTTFVLCDGEPLQRVHPHLESNIQQFSASLLQERELYQAITEEAYRPFDLEKGPLYRASLYKRSEVEYIFLLAAHHVVIDGWSYWVLLDELIKLYRAEKSGNQQLLSKSTFEYSDYVGWQAEMLEGERGSRLFEYWKQELSGDLPVLNLATSCPRPPVQSYSGRSYEFKLDSELVRELKNLAASSGSTLYMILLAVYQILLHRYTGQDDILVGSPISARSRAEFEAVVGCFFNAVVLRADFSSDCTFEQFLDQTRRRVLGGLDHQDYPTPLLAERLQPVRDPGRPPLFQATFILQKSQRSDHLPITFGEMKNSVGDAELALHFIPIERRHARVELELEMIEADQSIYAWLHYNEDLFDAALISKMAAHFKVLIAGVATNPGQRVSELPLLTEEEIDHLLAEQTFEPDDSDHSRIEDLFLEQVKKTPEKVAAVYADELLTFFELNEQSDQLAGLIRTLMK